MSYEKLKDESYNNLGGINTKMSPHLTQVTECLQLINFDFSQVGSWTKRPGTTLWNHSRVDLGSVTPGASGIGIPIKSITEFSRINGSSAVVVFDALDSLWVSTTGGLTGGMVFNSQTEKPNFLSFTDHLFMMDGRLPIYKLGAFASGFTTSLAGFSHITLFGLTGPVTASTFGVTQAIGGTLCGTTAVFLASIAWINTRGFVGPAIPAMTLILNGVTFASFTYYGITSLLRYNSSGITAVMLMRSGPNSSDLYETVATTRSSTLYTDSGINLTPNPARYSIGFTLRAAYPALINNQMFLTGISSVPSTIYWSDIGEPEMIDATWYNDIRSNDGDKITGVASFRSGGIVFKERSFTEFRANSPTDVSFNLVSTEYGCLNHNTVVEHDSYLYFLENKGIFQYDGAQPKIISSSVEAVFKDMNINAARTVACAVNNRQRNELWFAIPSSSAVAVPAADNTSSQIPNDTIVVYDYLVNAWSIWKGPQFRCMTYAYGGTSVPSVLFGDLGGNINVFGTSLTGDVFAGKSLYIAEEEAWYVGATQTTLGITCLVQTRFHHGIGETTEKLYRRLFVNSTPVAGATIALSVNFYKNYGTSLISGGTLFQNPFQSRIDFGLSAKSISVEISNFSATNSVQIPGYALAYKFLRQT